MVAVFAGLLLDEGSTCIVDEFIRLASLLIVDVGFVSAGLLLRTSFDTATLTGSLSIVGVFSLPILGVFPSSTLEIFAALFGFKLFLSILESLFSGTRPVDDDPFPLAGVLCP